MKLKERRTFQVIDRMRDMLMDSELDIGVLIPEHFFDPLKKEYSEAEVVYALRYVEGRGHLLLEHGRGYSLTPKGYAEWLFPSGPVDARSVFISYATEDKVLAGKLKAALEKIGLRA